MTGTTAVSVVPRRGVAAVSGSNKTLRGGFGDVGGDVGCTGALNSDVLEIMVGTAKFEISLFEALLDLINRNLISWNTL